jgi:predicted TIM-barrel fold metal-dependent hydrolase
MTASGYLKVDAHAHVLCNKVAAAEALTRLNIRQVVNISYSCLGKPSEIEEYESHLRTDNESSNEQFLFCPSFNVTSVGEPDYAETIIEKLHRDFTLHRAVAVKMWKDVGMMLQDENGHHIFCDDERFKPIFAWLNSRLAVVYLHIADPIEAWRPLDPTTPRGEYYSAHPEFYCHDKAGRPSHEELMEHRDSLVRAWPDIRFVSAHLASLEHDTDRVCAFLAAHRNAWVDVSARDVDLMLQPDEKVRDFFVRYQDRILWGSDWSPKIDFFGPNTSKWRDKIERVVASFQNRFRYFEEQLDLPSTILEKFYVQNIAALQPRVITDWTAR